MLPFGSRHVTYSKYGNIKHVPRIIYPRIIYPRIIYIFS